MDERAAVSQLVKKLGGPFAIACGLTENLGKAAPKRANIAQWPILGRIPWRWRHSVQSLVAERGIELTECEQAALILEPEREAS